MSKEFALTKEEFIERSMNGDVFIDKNGNKYYYDYSLPTPFRFNNDRLDSWWLLNGTNIFTLEKPKPTYEDRYIWLKHYDGVTGCSDYISDIYAEEEKYIENSWHKSDMKITVELES